jgi:hypothetical protein
MSKDWDRFKVHVAKKFSVADVGKGLLMGAGIGSFQQLAGTVGNFYRVAAEAAKVLLERTRDTLETTLRLISLRSSPAQKIANTQSELKGVRAEIDRQKQAVSDADLGFALHFSDEARENFNEANQELTRLLAKEGQLLVAIEEQKLAEKQRQQTLRDSGAELRDQTDLLRNQSDDVRNAERAANRSHRRIVENKDLPGSEERILDLQKAELEVEKAKKARMLAQLGGIKADSLARVGGGGGVFAPSGGGRADTVNPAQGILSESRKHTVLLTDIKGAIKFTSPTSNTTLK